MENRQHGHQALRSQAAQPTPAIVVENAPQWPPPLTRPLSDIREITEPSLIDIPNRPSGRQQLRHGRNQSKATSLRGEDSMKRAGSLKIVELVAKIHHKKSKSTEHAPSSYSSTPERSSFYSIPTSSVPKRSSSHNQSQRYARGHVRKPSIRDPPQTASTQMHPLDADRIAPPRPNFTIPNRGQSRSPVKEAGLRLDPITSDAARRVPSRTCVRSPQPADILEYPTYRHPRVRLELQVSAPLFVGGGSIEGFVKITIDENEREKCQRTLGIGAISVDLLGFEEMSGHRRAAFLALGTELIDASHPPPSNMIEPTNPLISDEKFWTLKPSASALPFMVSLPLDTGPPPFHSKQASIRFLLCVTVQIRDAGKHYRVRTSHDVCVLATYDPEKALTSLPSPLTASDELRMPRAGGLECLKLTAGLHRQVWVSGGSIFVDVHIANKSHKAVKRLDLTLERDILCYKHAAAATKEKSAGQARIFETNDQTIVAKSAQRQAANGWSGIDPYASETRTCDLDLPRGHATVKCGQYFEVRFFLNVTASLSNAKLVSVQLPIILVNINSLDVLPNSVAQVAAAIEEKRACHRHTSSRSRGHAHLLPRQQLDSSPARAKDMQRRPSYAQGRAFSAPRRQSLDRQRAEKADMDELCHIIDTSPRKHQPQGLRGMFVKNNSSTVSFGAMSIGGKSTGEGTFLASIAYRTPPSNRKARHFGAGNEDLEGLRDRLRRMRSFDSIRSKNSIARLRPRKALGQGERPKITHGFEQQHLAPHTLGLASSSRRPSLEMPSGETSRRATNATFREKLDRTRFEFRAVRRKASGGLKERGAGLWEQMRHRDKEKENHKAPEGWI